MWEMKKLKLQEDMAQQLMLRAIRGFVQTTVEAIHAELMQEQQRPMHFASQILAQAIAQASRYTSKG